jgi:ApbE superfamily uncharacterized protein (UPF0280 family)
MQDSRRDYRQELCPAGMDSFKVTVKETDLWIAVDREALTPDLPEKVESFVWQQRRLLEAYIQKDPLFARTLHPYLVSTGAPPLVLEMARAGNLAGVGPMAAVAGAFAQYTGEWLLKASREVIVENGGDIFLRCSQPVKVGVLASESLLGRRLAVRIKPQAELCGICTSSGTVGHSYSQGRADAAVILASSAALADAAATAAANMVQGPEDLKNALQFTRRIPGVKGALLLLEDKIAAWGQIELV